MNSPIIAHPDFYASLVFNSSDLISILSPTGVYKYVSNSSTSILGIAPEEFIGKNALEFVHPEDVAVAAEALGEMQFRQSIHLPPFRFRDKNGRWRWLDCVIKDMTADPNIKGIVSNARDITKRVEAEQQLAMHEAYYSSLFKNHPDGAFALNPQGIIETANFGLEPVLGLPLNEIIGHPYTDFVAPDGYSNPIANQAFLKALNGESTSLELRAINKTRGAIWLHITAIPVILNGHVVGVHGIAKDITEIKNAQNLIKEQAELLTSVFSSITEGFFVIDKNWRIQYANPFFITFFGLQVTPFKNQELWQLIPDMNNSLFYEFSQQAAINHKTTHFYEFCRQRMLRFAIYPFSGGLTVYFDDVTEQKKKEQELLDLSLVASRTTNGVVIMNAEGKIEWVNDGFSRLTGYSREEAVGQVPSKLLQGSATSPEISARIYHLYASQVPFSQEVLNYKKNGEIIWFHIDVTPVFDEDGNLVKYIAIENDITELKQKEAEMVKLTENLMRRNEDLQQFTYIVSHNLRAPVANLLGLSRLINSENRDSEIFEKALTKISAAATHLDMVISDLNKILSPLKNAGNSLHEPINIYTVVNAVTAGLQEQLEAVNAHLENRLSPDLILPGSTAYFYSIFNNLITNAIKYRNPEVQLKITISQQTESQKISILFTDNGMGMDLPQINNQLFQLYKRFHPGTEGRGIGLYLVKTQTETMGGRISVQSQPGEGTTFILTFSL
ncbi:PAS domain S-box protein [Adhaeribacter terreus]|uniref:histidine kinase n=1 Tax=Adhaeribacter terreus TaxID=529703 RepID=A0ABW0EDE9_9BACT